MALLWSDGFDRYSTGADLDLNYFRDDTSVAWNATAGVTGGGAVVCGSSFDAIRRTISGTLAAGGWAHVCFRLKPTSLTDNNGTFLLRIGTNLQSTLSSSCAQLFLNINGSLAVTSHGSAANTVIATSVAGIVTAGDYHHIEYAAKYNTFANGGVIKVWMDGNIVIDTSLTSVDTNASTVPSTLTGIILGNFNNPIKNWTFDDLIIWDESGTDFVYTQISASYLPVIETLSPDANDSVQFTPSAGLNFQNVDDALFHDGNTTNNVSQTVGHEDVFTIANQGSTPNYTFGVALKTIWKVDIAGIVAMRDKLDSGGTASYSADQLMTTSYVLAFRGLGKDPNTSATWGTSAINSVKTGYKYQS